MENITISPPVPRSSITPLLSNTPIFIPSKINIELAGTVKTQTEQVENTSINAASLALKKLKKEKKMRGVGLDIGTMNIVSSRSNGGKEIHHERIRDAFLDVPISAKKMLKLHADVSYIEEEDLLLIVGDHAFGNGGCIWKKGSQTS